MLVRIDRLLNAARAGGYAVGAFNIHDLEQGLGILEAAVEHESPVILAMGEGRPGGAVSMEQLFSVTAAVAAKYPVPVAINLDHGRTLEGVVKAIRYGATGVMLDASTLTHEENIKITRQAAEIAHWGDVGVEGEIGHVGQGTDYAKIDTDLSKLFTQPEDAVDFVEKTGVDSLAVAVGTAHGLYSGTPKLDFELLARLRDAVSVPLVLHGGSSSGDANLHRASTLGVGKVNIATDMSVAASERLAKMYASGKEPKRIAIRDVIYEMKLGFKEVSGHYMDIFGSTGKAKDMVSALK